MTYKPLQDDREVVKCSLCKLNQFVTQSRHCRRCHVYLAMYAMPALPELLPELTVAPSPQPSIQKRLQAVRIIIGMTGGVAASQSHISRSYLCKVEGSQKMPSYNTLHSLCQTYGVSVKELVSGDIGYILDAFQKELIALRRLLSPEKVGRLDVIVKELAARPTHSSSSS